MDGTARACSNRHGACARACAAARVRAWLTVALQLVYCAMPTSTFSLFSDAPFARRLRLHASQRRQESLRIAFQAHPMSDPAHFRGVDVPARVLPREARPSDPSRPKFAFSRLAYPPPPKNGNERLRTIRTLQAIGQMDSSHSDFSTHSPLRIHTPDALPKVSMGLAYRLRLGHIPTMRSLICGAQPHSEIAGRQETRAQALPLLPLHTFRLRSKEVQAEHH
eukprot:2316341-Pleurochrysis_carterae.AAC.1